MTIVAKNKNNYIEKFIQPPYVNIDAPHVNLISNMTDVGPFELPLVERKPISSWLIAGTLSFAVLMGLSSGKADALADQHKNSEKENNPVRMLKPDEISSAKVNLVSTMINDVDRRFAHINVQPHTNIAYTDIPWDNWTNITTHTNSWANHQHTIQDHININPGAPGQGGGVLY